MNLLAVTGSTGGIGRAVFEKCYQESAFAKYLLYFRNHQKMSQLLTENAIDQTAPVFTKQFVMEAPNPNLDCLPKSYLTGVSAITLVLSAFTIEPLLSIGADTLSLEMLQNNIHTNLVSQLQLLNQYVSVAEAMECRLYIVALDSGAAYRPIKGWSLYCSAKAYMSMYLQCLSLEKDCAVVLFDPGVVDTAMQKTIRNTEEAVFDQVQLFQQYYTHGLLHTKEQVANIIYDRYLHTWQAKDLKERFSL